MSGTYLIERLTQLLNLGYRPLPNKGKACRLLGWNKLTYVKDVLTDGPKGSVAELWPLRFGDCPTLGLRIDRGLGVIDIDVDDKLAMDLLAKILEIAPDVAARAPTRWGGGRCKMALFVRCDISPGENKKLNGAIRSARYRRPGDGPDKHHVVEIFLSSPGEDVCRRQFGVYGAHTPDVVDYVWSEAPDPLHLVGPADLPLLTLQQAWDILAAFERLASEAGWERLGNEMSAANAAFMFTIDESTRFEMQTGGEVGYADLAPGQRCTSSFHGDVGRNRTKCWVGMVNAFGVLGVWDHQEHAWFLPVSCAPVDTDALGPTLRDVAAEQNWASVPAPVPNWRERYRGGNPKPSFHNALLALEALDVKCTEDTFHGDVIVASPIPGVAGEITDGMLSLLRGALSDTYGLDFTEKHVRDAVMHVGHENRFDPVVNMLREAQAAWDGVERLDRMAVDILNCEDTAVARQCVRKTMIAAVARARQPGCKFDTILVLESPEGWNKSSLWEVLAGSENFSDESILGKASREVQEALARVWIHENAELAGMKKADVDIVKSFASRTVDRARPAYGHFLVNQPRHSIEVGTTNSDRYLQSQTGNRRFWPLRILKPIDIKLVRELRQQLWGEAAHYQQYGESLLLDEALWPAIGAAQEERRLQDPWEARLAALARVPTRNAALAGLGANKLNIIQVWAGEERVSTADIFEHALEMKAAHMEQRHARKLGEVMQALGWKSAQFKVEGVKTRGYVREVKKSAGTTSTAITPLFQESPEK